MDWYALFVETGKEDFVRTRIRHVFDESELNAIVPKRKLQERKQGRAYEVCKTMFPGYVLIKTRMNVNSYYELKQIPKCYRLLNKYNRMDTRESLQESGMDAEQESNLFFKIEEQEMALITQLMDSNATIGYSTVYVKNSKVIVCDGPLKGKEAIIEKIDRRKNRARISLEFMQKRVCFDVGIHVLDMLGVH
ncbi:antiterminator LoaP [Paenibacillus elgii]|uniref:antiterminator LoaP n=1 Tax=Paenibacillus elgii TaxID=189691 RepID=UPI000248DDCD|nr:antiterminator LoaP [Paenibacillus elgii]